MSTHDLWEELELADVGRLKPTARIRRRDEFTLGRFTFGFQRTISWVTELAGAPILVAAASGAVRGATFDQWVSGAVADATVELQGWLAVHLVHPSAARFLASCLPFALVGLGILFMAVLLIGIRNYIPCIVVSEIARRQGRTISLVDLVIVSSLPVSLAVAVARYGQVSVIAIGWFCLAFLFCRLSFHPKRLRGFLDWIVRLRGPLGTLDADPSDLDDGHGHA